MANAKATEAAPAIRGFSWRTTKAFNIKIQGQRSATLGIERLIVQEYPVCL